MTAEATIKSKINIVNLEDISVYRLNIRKIADKIFGSVYKPVESDRSMWRLPLFEFVILAVLIVYTIASVIIFCIDKDIVRKKLKGIKGNYGSEIELSEKQKNIRVMHNKALLKMAEGNGYTFHQDDIINVILKELIHERSEITLEEFIEANCKCNADTTASTILSALIAVVFCIRGSGVCKSLFTALTESSTFLVAFALGIHIAIHSAVFIMLLVIVFDKGGDMVSMVLNMITDMATYGVGAVTNGIQNAFISFLFTCIESPLLKNLVFAGIGIFLHKCVTFLLLTGTSLEADKIVDVLGTKGRNMIQFLASEELVEKYKHIANNYKEEIIRVAYSYDKNKIIDLKDFKTEWIGDALGIYMSRSALGNFVLFMLFCFAAYIIIFEIDITAIYYILAYAPDWPLFIKFRKIITHRKILWFKIFFYSVILFMCYLLFVLYPCSIRIELDKNIPTLSTPT